MLLQHDDSTINIVLVLLLLLLLLFVCVCACGVRVGDLVEVLTSCAVNVVDVDNTNSDESADVVSDELVSPHQVRQ